MSSPDFCLRSLSEIPGRKVFYEALLHFLSHHRGCGRTRTWVMSHDSLRLQKPEKAGYLLERSEDVA